MIATERRYDIDWLRVIAIGLLLIYHITIGFQPWGVLFGFIQTSKPLEGLWLPMSMLNVWRILILFFVSGMGVCFAMRRRNVKQLLLERTKRILVPLLFGMAIIVPLHMFLWQTYYQQDLSYKFTRGHLWFLYNIFIYVLVLTPFFYLLKKQEGKKLHTWTKRIFETPLSILLVIVFFVAEVLIIKPEIFNVYAMSTHGFVLGLLSFLFGFLCIYSGMGFWKMLRKWTWVLLSLAAMFFTYRLANDLFVPNSLIAVESVLWIFAVFGLANRYLNKPGKTLGYLSEAAYPIYILHMVYLYLASYYIFPIDMSESLKLVLVIISTTIGCFISYEFLIRRIGFIRPLFGLKK